MAKDRGVHPGGRGGAFCRYSVMGSVYVFVADGSLVKRFYGVDEDNVGSFMKRFFLLIIMVAFLSGCASMKCEPYGDTVWASGSHAYFSVWGYRDVGAVDAVKSKQEGWRGCPIQYGK
jgi:uncharacterized protein YceK